MLWSAKLTTKEMVHVTNTLDDYLHSYTLIMGQPHTIVCDISDDILSKLQCECGAYHNRLECPRHQVFAGQMAAHEMLGKDFF